MECLVPSRRRAGFETARRPLKFWAHVEKTESTLYSYRAWPPGSAKAMLTFNPRGKKQMSSEVYERIRRNPKFYELVSKRSTFAWTLTAVVLGLYFIFIMIVAFNPTMLAKPIWEGGTATIAWPIGAGLILLFWLLTGVYIRRANSEFDDLNSEIIRGAVE